MSRIDAFRALAADAFYGRIYHRLPKKDLAWSLSFLERYFTVEHGVFETTVNRLWLDSPEKPKRYMDIVELLLAANSRSAKAGRNQ